MDHIDAAPFTPEDGLPRLLLALRQAMALSCEALVRFELRQLEEQTDRQRQLAKLVNAILEKPETRACLASLLGDLRETAALNRVQAALVAGGCRAVKLEANLARLAHPEGAPAYGEHEAALFS